MNNYKNRLEYTFLLIKAIGDIATETYKSKSNIFITRLENTEEKQFKDNENKVLLNLKRNNAKIVKEYTEEEKVKYDEIQKQIDELKAQQDKLGKDKIVKEEYNSLVAHYNEDVTADATARLTDLIAELDNKTASNAFNKVKGRV
jgi:hypothetical protein